MLIYIPATPTHDYPYLRPPQSVAALVPSCLIVTTLPSYSDSAGRKLALLSPLVGFAVSTSILLLVAYLELPIYVMVIASVFRGYPVDGRRGGGGGGRGGEGEEEE